MLWRRPSRLRVRPQLRRRHREHSAILPQPDEFGCVEDGAHLFARVHHPLRGRVGPRHLVHGRVRQPALDVDHHGVFDSRRNGAIPLGSEDFARRSHQLGDEQPAAATTDTKWLKCEFAQISPINTHKKDMSTLC